MPDTNCKEYPGVPREAITKFREQAEKDGKPLPPGDSFVIEKSGVKLSVEYTESTQLLKLCIIEKPGFIPEAMVWAIVEEQMKRGG